MNPRLIPGETVNTYGFGGYYTVTVNNREAGSLERLQWEDGRGDFAFELSRFRRVGVSEGPIGSVVRLVSVKADGRVTEILRRKI